MIYEANAIEPTNKPHDVFLHTDIYRATFALFPAWMAGLAQLKEYRTIICQVVG